MPERSQVVMRLLLVLLILQFSGGGFSAPVSQVTYVYEKDQNGGVPPGVQFALRALNVDLAGRISAAAIEADVKDSTGNTPPQYKIAVEAAKAVGLPALVVQAGEKVVKTVSAPSTAEQVTEAVQ